MEKKLLCNYQEALKKAQSFLFLHCLPNALRSDPDLHGIHPEFTTPGSTESVCMYWM